MKNHLLNNKALVSLLQDDPIVVLDGGARGTLFKPFGDLVPQIVKVLKFEPDPGASIQHNKNEIIVPKALYDKTGTINLNIAVQPAASSVFPFNRELQQYIDPHADVRKTAESVSVECTSLDEFCQEASVSQVDFIKLDIHGCEHEVLTGAKEALNNTLGLLVENWVLPIHKGQHTRASIELMLFERQFYVFEEYVQSAWGRMGKKYRKKQPVTIDTLYFRDPLIDHTKLTMIQALKLIGTAELFEHYGYAEQLTEYFKEKKVLDSMYYSLIKDHFKKYNQTTFVQKIQDKFYNYFGSLINRQSFK